MKKAMKQSALTVAFSILKIVLILAVSVLFLWSVSIAASIEEATVQQHDLTYNATKFVSASNYLTNQVRAYAATGDEIYYNNYYTELNDTKRRESAVSTMKSIGLEPEEERLIDDLANASNTLAVIEETAFSTVRSGDRSTALAIVYGSEYQGYMDSILQMQDDFTARLDNRTSSDVEKLYAKQNYATLLIAVLLVGLVAIQLVYAVFIFVKVVRPVVAVTREMNEIVKGNLSSTLDLKPDTSEIGQLIHAIQQTKDYLNYCIRDTCDKLAAIASGDMTVQVDTNYKGDFAPIGDSLKSIVESLNHLLCEIDDAACQIAADSSLLSNGAQALSQGSTEQASAIVQLSATLDDISEKITNTADTAMATSEKANLVGNEMRQSNQKMRQMVTAMHQIEQISGEIGKIVNTINGIAFQTNILSLNAAVEAARAGNAGKGFAVVADEVRTLAAKSTKAVEDTDTLIQTNLHAVLQGAAVARETASALEQVIELADEVIQAMDIVSDAAKIQSEAVIQLNVGMDQISDVIQTNSSTAEESASSSEELSSQAQILRSMVDSFVLRGRNDRQQRFSPPASPASSATFTDRNTGMATKY